MRSASDPAATRIGPTFADHAIVLPGGRPVRCAEYGERRDLPILYCHGFLGSRLEPRAAMALDGNVLAPDRPGYADTTAAPPLSLEGFGRDCVDLLDALGVDRCAVVGVSAGGPFALAAALALQTRAATLVLACAVADASTIRAQGGAVSLLDRFGRHPALTRALLKRLVAQALRHDLHDRFVKEVLRDEVGRFAPGIDGDHVWRSLSASLGEGQAEGVAGLVADIELLTRPWHLDLAALQTPILVLHGLADRVVPPAHAQRWAELLPRARLMLRPGLAHFSLVLNELPLILRPPL